MRNSTDIVSHLSGNAGKIKKNSTCETLVDGRDVNEMIMMASIPLPDYLRNVPRRVRSKQRKLFRQVKPIKESQIQLHQAEPMHTPPGASKKRVTKKVAKESIDSEDEDYYRPCSFSRQRRGNRNNTTNQDRKLDSEQVYSYLENLWHRFPEEKKSSFTHLDPLWYTLYSEDSNKEKVMKWIKRKDIFSRKYVVFPIVQWGHWSLLIFCHLGESLDSQTKTPCILFLDSLEKADHSKQLEPVIRKFVVDIYKNLERKEDKKQLHKMPFLVPKVPQQRDKEECGFFVLYYIKLFVESAPESFSIFDGYPYFMKKDWFDSEGLEGFCNTIDYSRK